jgi:hypothetical protein
MTGNAMNETPRQQSEAVKHEIREEHGDAAEATTATPQAQDHVSPGEFESDPACHPDNEAPKNVKGA